MAPNFSPYLLSLDIGTSSVRALVFDCRGIEVGDTRSRRAYTVSATPDGGSEFDADAVLGLVASCIDESLALARSMDLPVAGVAAATMVTTMLAVDPQGLPLTKVMTYADTRSADHAARLAGCCDAASVHDRTGCPFHPAYWPARFAWMRQTMPDIVSRASRWMSIGDFLMFNFFGTVNTSYSVASWSGLLDRRTLKWDLPLLKLAQIEPDKLPALGDLDNSRTGLSSAYRDRWPLLADVPWFPAVGDGAAANIGCGCLSSNEVAITVGTSSAVRVIVPATPESIPRGLWCYRVDRKRSLVGGALTEGGNIHAWIKSLAGGTGTDLDGRVAAMAPGSHGLIFLPALGGERSPGWNAGLRGAISGLRLSTTAADILRAGMEAVALRLCKVYELLSTFLPGENRIVAGGGGMLKSAAWLKIVTDVFGKPVFTPAASEVSARGAALLALENLGIVKNLSALSGIYEEPCLPDPGNHEIYLKEMAKLDKLYAAMTTTAFKGKSHHDESVP
jgi:gluconokinase